jgi:hypothetical protein
VAAPQAVPIIRKFPINLRTEKVDQLVLEAVDAFQCAPRGDLHDDQVNHI